MRSEQTRHGQQGERGDSVSHGRGALRHYRCLLALKSTPMVACKSVSKVPSVKRSNKLDLPTAESPTSSSCEGRIAGARRVMVRVQVEERPVSYVNRGRGGLPCCTMPDAPI
jgi:hypothetical protein